MDNKPRNTITRNYLDTLSFWRDYPERDIEFVRWYPCDVNYLTTDEVFASTKDGNHDTATFYMHIPFCNQVCTSCPYNKFNTRNTLVDRYLEAIKNEITTYSQLPYFENVEMRSGYLGGGTPTTLRAEQFDDLFTHFHRHFHVRKGSSITVESTPIDIDPKKIAVLLKHGVDRVSMGVQTFNDKQLRNLGRAALHTGDKTIETIEMLQREGMQDICIDLMIGIPGQTMETWKRDIDILMSLPVNSFSVYLYLVLPASDAFFRIQSGQMEVCPTTELQDEMYWYMVDKVLSNEYVAVTYNDFGGPMTQEWRDKGVTTYPIIGLDGQPILGRNGEKYEGLDTSSFYLTDHLNHSWYECGDMLSLGSGAYGFLNNNMYLNEPDIENYIQYCNEGKLPITMGGYTDSHERMCRSLVLGLKLLRVLRKDFRIAHGVDMYEVFKDKIDSLIEKELVILTDDALQVTYPKGLFYIDNICKTFYSNRNYRLPQPSPTSTEILQWRKSTSQVNKGV